MLPKKDCSWVLRPWTRGKSGAVSWSWRLRWKESQNLLGAEAAERDCRSSRRIGHILSRSITRKSRRGPRPRIPTTPRTFSGALLLTLNFQLSTVNFFVSRARFFAVAHDAARGVARIHDEFGGVHDCHV